MSAPASELEDDQARVRSPRVSAILVSYNTLECLPIALDALPEACSPLSWEAIVVDNASTDGSVEALRGREDITFIPLDRNTGFTHAANVGAAEARGDYLLFLNPDVLLPPRSIAGLVDALSDHPSAWAATAWFRNPDLTPQYFWRRIPGPLTLALCHTRAGRKLDRLLGSPGHRHRTYRELPDPPPAVEIEAVGAACLLVRKSLFDEAGRFDERYFNFFQDADLERRMRRSGYTLLGVGTIDVIHILGVTMRKLPAWEADAQYLHALRQYLAGEARHRRWLGEAVLRLDLALPGPHAAERRRRALRPVGAPQ